MDIRRRKTMPLAFGMIAATLTIQSAGAILIATIAPPAVGIAYADGIKLSDSLRQNLLSLQDTANMVTTPAASKVKLPATAAKKSDELAAYLRYKENGYIRE